MTTAVVSPAISTTVRSIPWASGVVRAYFAVASRLHPELARRQAERVFTTPPAYGGRGTHPVAARRESVVAGRHALAVWQAGPSSAPAVLLAHGWGGRGTQMGGLVEPLLAAGYRVVWFDQPGHGESGGGRVALPDFVRAVEALATTHGPFEAAVGHSLGAAALGVAMRNGVRIGRVVFVSPPASIAEHTHSFARLLGLTARVRDAMRRRIEHRYGMPFAEIDRIEDLGRVQVPALFVHDRADPVIGFEQTVRLARSMAFARIVKTHGLGHFRILRDAAVVRTIVDFVGGENDLPAELPALPRPAPLY